MSIVPRHMLPSIALLVTILTGVAIARSLVIAQPDEWLVCIRNGKLVKAGVGIYLWRRPGDVVVRFSSTVQRVAFAVDALSCERLRVSIDGLVLWSVSPEGDGPFRAFQKLGLVNLAAPPRDLKSPKHLLTTPQHRAFRELLGSAVQRLAAAKSVEDLLLRQSALVVELRNELAALEAEMGIRFEQIEIVRVRPTDEELLRQMSAEIEAQVRQEAARQELAVAKAAIEREELVLAARLDRIRREAEANRDAITAVASAEEKKSQAVRDHELNRLVAEKVADALKELPLREARWVTVGPDSPLSSLAALIMAAKDARRSERG